MPGFFETDKVYSSKIPPSLSIFVYIHRVVILQIFTYNFQSFTLWLHS